MFSLSSVDCAGETILKAFFGEDGEGARREDADESGDNDDLLVSRVGGGLSERDIVSSLREAAVRASAICLVLNPNDFPSNLRRDIERDDREKRDFEARFKAMRRLSLSIAQDRSLEGRRLFVVLTQTGDDAIRSGLEASGDPASYIEAEFPALLRSAPNAECLAVSAVNEVDEVVDPDTGRRSFVPAHGFTSSGLAEFLVRIGSALSPELQPVGDAWRTLR